MIEPQETEAEVPASSDERVEAFAEFLEQMEEDQDPTGGVPPEEDDQDRQEDEPEDPAIGPPVSWDNDAKALFADPISRSRNHPG